MSNIFRMLTKPSRRPAPRYADDPHGFLHAEDRRERVAGWGLAPEGQGGGFPLMTGMLLRTALREGADEMVIEPDAPGGSVRSRVGGEERELLRLRHFWRPFLSHNFRVLADLAPAEGRYPQQGAFTARWDGKTYGFLLRFDLTPWGEKATLTIAAS